MTDDQSRPGSDKAAGPTGATPADQAAAMFSAMQSALDAGLKAIADVGATAASPRDRAAGDGPSIAPELAPVVGRAMLAAAGSSLRYWRDLTALYDRRQAGLLQAVGLSVGQQGLTGQECRVAADELRAFLREAGEVATLEAQKLRLELAALDTAVADIVAQGVNGGVNGGVTDAAPTRRWRAKP